MIFGKTGQKEIKSATAYDIPPNKMWGKARLARATVAQSRRHAHNCDWFQN